MGNQRENAALRALEHGLASPAPVVNPPAAAPVSDIPLMARLLLRDRPLRNIPLHTPRTVLGRDPTVAIHLDHSKVSRHHAELVCDPNGKWWLSDLGSRNHTFVNNRETRQRTQVVACDVIGIAPFTIEIIHGTTVIAIVRSLHVEI